MNAHKSILLAMTIILLGGGLVMESVYAASGTDMDALSQFIIRIGLGIGIGSLISIVSKLGGTETWNNRKLGYGIVVAVFSAFVVVDGFKEAITFDNAMSLVLQIVGSAFFANEGIKMAAKAKASSNKPK